MHSYSFCPENLQSVALMHHKKRIPTQPHGATFWMRFDNFLKHCVSLYLTTSLFDYAFEFSLQICVKYNVIVRP